MKIVLVESEAFLENKKLFASNINKICEDYHVKTGKPRQMICTIMVEKFRGKIEGGMSDDWIRKRIEPKYKMAHRITNVKQKKISKVDRIKSRLNHLNSELLQATHEISVVAKKDLG